MASGTTAKEREARRARVAELVAEGLSNSRIAKELGVSAATVKRDRAALEKAGKLDAHGTGPKGAAKKTAAAENADAGEKPAGPVDGKPEDKSEATGENDKAAPDETAGDGSDSPKAGKGSADEEKADEPAGGADDEAEARSDDTGGSASDASEDDAKPEDDETGGAGEPDVEAAGSGVEAVSLESAGEGESEELGDGWDSPLEEEIIDDIPFITAPDARNEVEGAKAAEPTTAAELAAKVDEQREHVDDAYNAAVAATKQDGAAPSFEPRAKAVHPSNRVDRVKLASDRAAIANERRNREVRNATSLRGVMRSIAFDSEDDSVMDVHEWWQRFSEEQDVYYSPFKDRRTGRPKTRDVDREEWEHFISLDDAGKYRYMLRKRRDDRAATAAVLMAVVMVVSVIISLANLG